MVKIVGGASQRSLPLVAMLHFTLDRALPQCGEVLPVLSLPARVIDGSSSTATDAADGVYDKVLQLCHAVHATCVRQIPISLPQAQHADRPTLSTTAVSGAPSDQQQADTFCAYALESPGYLGIAGKVWDSMYVLLQYLSLHAQDLVTGKRVIELGCGTGLAGTHT